MTSLQSLMKEIHNLKPIPAVVNQLLAVVDTPDSSMEDIARVIQYDPIITASLLKTCNSAFFGLKTPAESIKDAVNMLGIDHAELGAMIAKMWKFSPKMIKIIRHHHLTEESMRNDREIAGVYLADCICMMMGVGVGADGLCYRFKDQVMKDLGVTAEDILMIVAQFGVNMQEVDAFLHMAGNN
jgi:HD-like signal output (HDOD) protein